MKQLEKVLNFLQHYPFKENEIFKEIPGTFTEASYYISNRGKVLSFCRNSFKFLKPDISTGYKRVKINKENRLIHRLVAEAFIPNPENKAEVHHKDKNPHNNRAENLMWLSSEEHRAEHQEDE